MQKKKYNRTSHPFSRKGESGFGESQTVPNLAPSARELLKRHAQGLKDNVSQDNTFSGDLPDYRGMEPHELDHLMFQNQQVRKDLEQQANANALKLREAERKQKEADDLATYNRIKKQQDAL